MNYAITTDGINHTMTFDQADDLANNVYLSLMIQRGSFFIDPTFGLKVRPGLKLTDESAALRKLDIEQALKWITDAGRARKITVAVNRVEEARYSRLECLIEVERITGYRTLFTYFQEVI